jgi:hypothetical protein
MAKLEWEMVEAEPSYRKIERAKVPGGWLIRMEVGSSGGETSGEKSPLAGMLAKYSRVEARLLWKKTFPGLNSGREIPKTMLRLRWPRWPQNSGV